MTAPIAGWYADPAGDATKLRYWDGAKWTDSVMDAPAPSAAQAAQTGSTTQPPQPTAAYDAAYGQPTPGGIPPTGIPVTPPADATQQPYATPGVGAAPQAQQPTVNVNYTQTTYANYADAPLYYVSQQDATLRLVAFILALISTITAGFMIIPLAWMIPMTVMTWGIYKGKRPNTVAFGVCSLIFLNVVGGILLLVSTKDE